MRYLITYDISDNKLRQRFSKHLRQTDLKLYQKIMSQREHHVKIFTPQVMQHFRQHVQGQLNFVRYIKGKDNLVYLRLLKRIKKISNGGR